MNERYERCRVHGGLPCPNEYSPCADFGPGHCKLAGNGPAGPCRYTDEEQRTFERRRLKVYVAGPISKGDVFENIMKGLQWGRRMLFDGLAPYIPHLDAYLTLAPGTPPADQPSMWNAFLEWDLEWVASSDAVFRIAGESKGADLEVEVAKSLGIPVFTEDPDPNNSYVRSDDYAGLLRMAEQRGLAGVRK